MAEIEAQVDTMKRVFSNNHSKLFNLIVDAISTGIGDFASDVSITASTGNSVTKRFVYETEEDFRRASKIMAEFKNPYVVIERVRQS